MVTWIKEHTCVSRCSLNISALTGDTRNKNENINLVYIYILFICINENLFYVFKHVIVYFLTAT